LFRVRLDITVPGREIVVGRESKPRRSHQDISGRDSRRVRCRPPTDRGSRTYLSR
jgi:hypothetical protein